ncbi:MAG: 50S ribosomal protein L11 methyltransferase [Candidatus Adiutrix sp.]
MENLTWLKITINHPPWAAEALSCLLFDEDAAGVWQQAPDELGREVMAAGFKPSQEAHLRLRLPQILAKVAAAFDLAIEEFDFSLSVEENHDWAEKWKEGLEPICISNQLLVAPTWHPQDDLVAKHGVLPTLRLDPGLAFGSGHHATTFLCLEAMVQLAPHKKRILDIGAGSGILAIAAAALNNCAYIIGVDNDPSTIEVAQENAALNNLGHRVEFSAKPLSALRPPFDLMVANITLNPLIELAETISALAAPQGHLILSGLLTGQVAQALASYPGWRVQSQINQDEWAALILTNDGALHPSSPQS